LNAGPTPPDDGIAAAVSAYPVRLEVRRPARQSRLTNFPLLVGTFIRMLLAVPNLVILYFLHVIAGVVYSLATFAILFTGRYPRGMFDFYAGYTRWNARVSGYLSHLYDEYPPFSYEAGNYALSFEADYAETRSRVLNFPILGPIDQGDPADPPLHCHHLRRARVGGAIVRRPVRGPAHGFVPAGDARVRRWRIALVDAPFELFRRTDRPLPAFRHGPLDEGGQAWQAKTHTQCE
jgi:hypothetical protein